MFNKAISKNVLAGLLLVTAVGPCLFALGFAWVWGKERQRDEELCRGGPSPAHVVALVDTTDPLTPDQLRVVRSEILRLGQSLKQDERLSIYRLEPQHEQVVQTLFSKCNPGDGTNADPSIENPGKMQRDYSKIFLKPLKEEAIEVIGEGGQADTSPILEAIHWITGDGAFIGDIRVRRLVIFSDMLEFSEHFNHYREPYSFAQFNERPPFSRLTGKLQGVETRVFYIQRPHHHRLQDEAHERFWREFFADAGAQYELERL